LDYLVPKSTVDKKSWSLDAFGLKTGVVGEDFGLVGVRLGVIGEYFGLKVE
jgi:hypothetical protein